MNNITSTVIGLINKKTGKSPKRENVHTGGNHKVHCLKESEKVLVKEALDSIEKNGVISGQEVIERLDKRR